MQHSQRFTGLGLVLCGLTAACASSAGTNDAEALGGAAGMAQAGTSASSAGAGGLPAAIAGSAGAGAPANSAGSAGLGGAAQFNSAGASGASAEAGAGGAAVGGAAGTGALPALGHCGAGVPLLCEGFEDGLDDAVWEQLFEGDGSVVADETHPHLGQKSLHVTVTGSKAAISETKTFPLEQTVLYVRMYVWFDEFDTDAHFTLLESPQEGGGDWLRFGGQLGKFGVGADHGGSGDWTDVDEEPVPTQRWLCLEVEFNRDTNEYRVWQDDEERTALNRGAMQHNGFVMPPFASLWFGWQTYGNQASMETWIDDIVVDTQRIGCVN